MELDRRFLSYKNIQQTFGWNNIPTISIHNLCTGAANLQKKYAGDLEEDFVDEMKQFREFIKKNEDTSVGLGIDKNFTIPIPLTIL